MDEYPERMAKCIKKVRDIMIDYQATHNITGRCISNSYLFRDMVRQMGFPCKMVATMSVSETREGDKIANMYFCVHMIVQMWDDCIFDVSHEIYKNENKSYYTNFKDFADEYKYITETYLKQHGKEMVGVGLSLSDFLKKFLDFQKHAERVNAGESIEKDDYYHSQEEHIHKEMNIFMGSL